MIINREKYLQELISSRHNGLKMQSILRKGKKEIQIK